MKTFIDMSSYDTELDEMEMEYDEEIISAGWNPSVDLINEELLQVPTEEQITMAADLTTLNSEDDFSGEISEMFLRKMYSYQH